MQLTSAAGDKFPDAVAHYYELFDYIGQHMMLPAPTIRDGMPNMYAGLLILILLPIYFLSKRICLREKFAHIILIIFMILSFNINTLNFIWHGMHFPNQLPYRNSFVYIFLLLAMLYPVTGWLKEVGSRFIGSVCLGLMILVLLGQKLNQTEPSLLSIYATIIFLAIFAAVLTIDRSRKMSLRDISRALLLIVVAELLVNTLLTVHTIDTTEHYSSRDGYASGSQVEAIRTAIKSIETEEEDLFYRMEIMPPKTTNDPYLYQYNGLSIFSSTAATAPVSMFENLGFHSNGINSYKYEGSTIVLDSLFGIRYLMRRSGNVNDQVRQMIMQNDHITVYKNPYALPIGYLGTEAVTTWKSAPGNPLEAQNNLVQALGGLPGVLMPVEQQEADHENITLEESNNVYRFNRTNSDQLSTARIKIVNPVSQNLYAYLKVTANQPREGYFLIDGERISFNARRSTMVDLGYVEADADIELNLLFDTDSPQDSRFEFYSYSLDEQAFEQSMALISSQALNITKFKSRVVEGNVSITRDGVFVMTMPYDTGWTVKVNGEKVETIAIDEGLLGFRLQAGDHEIEMKYTPPWFIKGMLISLGSLLLLLILYRLPFGIGRAKSWQLPKIYKEWQIIEIAALDDKIDRGSTNN